MTRPYTQILMIGHQVNDDNYDTSVSISTFLAAHGSQDISANEDEA